jgi:lactam utilization protein B
LKLHADTLCIHGDGPTALAIAQAVRATFQEAGVIVCALKA